MIADQQTAARNWAGNAEVNVEHSQSASADMLQPAPSRRAVWNAGVRGDESGKPYQGQDNFTR